MFTILLCSGAGIAVLGSAIYTAKAIDGLLGDATERRAPRPDAPV